tara:strand:- start:158 stop:772 length:615 start_codon:yes stop_codon:yes gene_type:complete
MWAQVDNNKVTKVYTRPTAFSIGDNNYPANTMSVWSEAELNALDIWEVVEDRTNVKDEEWYINTNVTHTYNSGTGKVDATWGTATAKAIVDTKWTQVEIDAGLAPEGADTNTVKDEGLKTYKKRIIDEQCAGILAPSDWRVTKQEETGSAMDSGWKTWRASIRTKCNSMQAQIDGVADVDALAALYTRTGEPPTRPLGEFPVKE